MCEGLGGRWGGWVYLRWFVVGSFARGVNDRAGVGACL